MTIKFYKNLSDKHEVDKKITQVGNDLTGTLRNDSAIVDPVILIEDFTSFNLASCNYAYISEFGRYYYITEIIVKSDKLYEIHMHVDVLMSFKTGIRSNKAVISRQQNLMDLYLNDGVFKTKAYPKYDIIKFPTGFTGYHYVLTVAGS